MKKQVLTFREMQVSGCVAACLTNPEIADLLGISEQTIKEHLAVIFRKIAVSSRTGLAVYWHTGRFAE